MELLLVIDMQTDFIDGALGTPEAQAILPKVAEKIRAFSGLVRFTRDTHGADYLDTAEGKKLPVPHCIQGTPGWEIHPDLQDLCTQAPLDKPTFGSLALGDLVAQIHRETPLEKITLVGLCTDICVISNAMILKAALPEVTIAVDGSCCAGVSPGSHENALQAMAMCQIEII